MDIQSLGEAGTAPAAPATPQPQAAAVSTPQQQQPSNASTPSQPSTPSSSDKTLAHTVAGILGAAPGDNVHVSYRIEKPDEIVTVFTDASGHEIAQVPSEAMIQIAQFFDAHSGVTLDQCA